MASKIVVILGAGPRVGAGVTKHFVTAGYKVAIASRSSGSQAVSGAPGILSLKADFSKPDSIASVFDAVRAEFKSAPSVVVYNAAGITMPTADSPVLFASAESVSSDLAVNVVSPYVAAQQAVKEWESLPGDVKKTFIYTGNALNTTVLPVPMFLTLGMGKSASAYWLGMADMAYTKKGYRCDNNPFPFSSPKPRCDIVVRRVWTF
jgi:NAD(P)-dependent dehydrogenase (short-subunit alcohol dehydrogenase family)